MASRTTRTGTSSETRARKQFTITVPPELGEYIEERSAATGLNKSSVVSRALEAEKEREEEQLMREGYEAMPAQDRELLKEFEHVDRDSNASWPDY